jgi:N-acyl-L-homoserine lactone synthetase
MIVTVSGRDRPACNDLFNQFFRLRYNIFVVQRRWTLPCKGTLEVDQYDNENAVYFYHVDDAGEITSHVRLTPSMTDSLLADAFTHLVESPEPIRSPTVYEGTRYIVLPRHKTRACNRAAKAELLLAVNEWARDHGITHTQVIIETTLLASFMEMTPEVRPMGLSQPYAGGPDVDGGGESIAIRCPANDKVIADLRAYGGFAPGERSYQPLVPHPHDTTVH